MDLQIAVNSEEIYTKNFNYVDMNINIVTWNESLADNVQLIIAADVQSCTVRNLTADLRPGYFILLEETSERLDLKIALKEANMILIGRQIDSSGRSYLLLKKRKKSSEPIVIQITGKDLSWLENAKAVLKKLDGESQYLLFVSQDDESLGKVMRKLHIQINLHIYTKVDY